MEAGPEHLENLPKLTENQLLTSSLIIGAIKKDQTIEMPEDFEYQLAVIIQDGKPTPPAPIWWGAGRCAEYIIDMPIPQVAALFKAGIVQAEAGS